MVAFPRGRHRFDPYTIVIKIMCLPFRAALPFWDKLLGLRLKYMFPGEGQKIYNGAAFATSELKTNYYTWWMGIVSIFFFLNKLFFSFFFKLGFSIPPCLGLKKKEEKRSGVSIFFSFFSCTLDVPVQRGRH